ncbi:chromosome segregation in meiosis protein 3 [Aspergillus sclerotiicarbonarius CBS 121057]|uniref:Chromosome segregation in meiosis protein n=1 Tax=Aspergillus sclerotiicarbonarius (strain CBS 121057 / IBT 28362) TaxID=1448318 RepID=A0A319F7G7_ASPSB|nr:chromosome segregation in meiosis protein 3 [Aspergillus sclerotiicarbonarius CBS 121057]
MEENVGHSYPLMDHDDTLFDYDAGLESTLQETALDLKKNEAVSAPVLGVDEKITITKQRRYTVKLDEGRLLSHSGIPKLRLTAKQKLRFKGKGHEFSDAARLLNFYQLWLDDLFPRAKFADGLAMIEKLGHSKRLQTMRREWIEEEKPKLSAAESEDVLEKAFSSQRTHDDGIPIEHRHDADTVPSHKGSVIQAPPAHGLEWPSALSPRCAPAQKLFASDEESVPMEMIEEGAPDDDELDALLREHEDGIIGKNDLVGLDISAGVSLSLGDQGSLNNLNTSGCAAN